MGRRSKYDPDTFPKLAYQYARDGMIDREIAAKLGISEHTLNVYKRKYPQFDQSLKDGKAPVDVEVENALLKSAMGYDLEVEEDEYDGNGNLVKKKKTKNHVKPNPTSLIFWLKNRQPAKWRDKQEIEHSGEIKIDIDEDDAGV